MFIGHYGAALALKRADAKIPLWIYILMTTLPDIILYILMLAEIEVVEKSPGFTKWVPMKAVYYPFSHGLISNIIIACIIFIVVSIIMYKKRSGMKFNFKVPLVLSAAFLSHFLCDIPVHAQDLAVNLDGTIKLGLGLWNYPVLSNLLEIVIFLAGLYLYRKSVSLVSINAGKYFILFTSLIIILHFMSGFIEPMDNMKITAFNLLILSVVVITASWYFEKKYVNSIHSRQ